MAIAMVKNIIQPSAASMEVIEISTMRRNGLCDGGKYKMAACGFDGGDCDFVNKHPNCTAATYLPMD
eukprot:scaffold1364_cov216-Chaetoceros_neogracile.AAC.5